MRIVCDVSEAYISQTTAGASHKGRTKRSTLILFRGNKKVCVEILTTATRQVYNITNNVEKIFHRFVREGKATLRLKQPSINISLSRACPVQLQSFLQVIHQGSTSTAMVKIQLPTGSQSQGTKSKPAPAVDLLITSARDPRLRLPFSSHLLTLTLTGCGLRQLYTSILSLQRLQKLDLSDNRLASLPVHSGQLRCLTTLRLDSNLLTHLPISFFLDTLSSTLTHLSVSRNRLGRLDAVMFCAELVSLDCAHNNLPHLPHDLGRLPHLTTLSVEHNPLTYLPITLFQGGLGPLDTRAIKLNLNVSHLDTTRSPESLRDLACSVALPSLQELAACVVANKKISFTKADLPTQLRWYLLGCQCCHACGLPYPGNLLPLYSRCTPEPSMGFTLTTSQPHDSSIIITRLCCFYCSFKLVQTK